MLIRPSPRFQFFDPGKVRVFSQVPVIQFGDGVVDIGFNDEPHRQNEC